MYEHSQGRSEQKPMKNVGNNSRGRCQGVPKIFRAPMYRSHCAVIFAIAHLFCSNCITDNKSDWGWSLIIKLNTYRPTLLLLRLFMFFLLCFIHFLKLCQQLWFCWLSTDLCCLSNISKVTVNSFPSHMAHRAALISITMALSQTDTILHCQTTDMGLAGYYSLCLPTEGWPGWVDLGGWLHTWGPIFKRS